MSQRNAFEPWFFLDPTVVVPLKFLKGRYALGLFFLFLVAIIWTISSVMVQYLYAQEEFGSAFLMTYLGFIEFAFILPLKQLTDLIGVTKCIGKTEPLLNIIPSKEEKDETTTTKPSEDNDDISIKTAQILRKFPANVHWNHGHHLQAACFIAPIMFIANWTYNAALASTSVASCTVLVSTSSVFVFVFAVWAGDEKYTHTKLFGVMLGLLGTVLTAYHDFTNHDDDEEGEACADGCDYILWGDSLAMVAAVAYAAYAVQVRVICPRDEELYSMVLLLGYIGLVILIPLLPVALILLTQFEMNQTVLAIILFRGFLDFVVSEYLHFRAVVLTNATTATVGLGLTIPMAFFADWLLDKANIASPLSMFGAVAVSAGFLVVNLGNSDGASEIEDIMNDIEDKHSIHYTNMEPPTEVTTVSRGVLI